MSEKYEDLKSYLYMTLILAYGEDVAVLQDKAQDTLDGFIGLFKLKINATVKACKDGEVTYFRLTSEFGTDIIACPEMHSVNLKWDKEGF